MANDEHVAMLKKGVDAWNEWRQENQGLVRGLCAPDLMGANLTGGILDKANLNWADLRGANLAGANLTGAQLEHADLTAANLTERANLHGANLIRANLHLANLAGSVLSDTLLLEANLTGANLTGAQLSTAVLARTVFGQCDLTEAKGLDQCNHEGPSIIDFQTLQKSGPLPLAFLRGVGLPDNVIDYLPSLLNTAIKHYSCFISYSSKDRAFAHRLYTDLQNKGVRCWFDAHDMRTGAKIIDTIDEAIRLRDKVLLILSEAAIASDWVEREVTGALDEETARQQVILFPVRIDDAVKQTSEPWARLLRRERHIEDFTGSYQEGFDRLMLALRVENSGR